MCAYYRRSTEEVSKFSGKVGKNLLALTVAGAALIFLVGCFLPAPAGAQSPSTFYVAPNGSDSNGNGSITRPWATLAHAAKVIPDSGSTVLVMDGTYDGQIRLNRRFINHTVFKARSPYRARLVNSSQSGKVVISYGGANFTLEGFEIARPGPASTGSLIMHVQQGGVLPAENIVIRNNIFHDSYNNDILKVNNRARNIVIERNVFYNQQGPDEHIDVNGGARNIVIRDNIFFNDFRGSGRVNNNNTSSYIVIKDSGGYGTQDITVQRNVFLNWEGSSGQSFVRVGEDGKSYYEADRVLVENNLLVGNSPNLIRAPFTVSGARNVTFRNNTVVGNLPAQAYGMRLNRQGQNPANANIFFYNNIWSDSTGTMGDFSDGSPNDTLNALLDGNLYWNNGSAIPPDGDVLNIADDANALVKNPLLGGQNNVVLPRWNRGTAKFLSGSTAIRQEFQRLVFLYGAVPAVGAGVDAADPANAPADDILGNVRDVAPDIGAFEAQ